MTNYSFGILDFRIFHNIKEGFIKLLNFYIKSLYFREIWYFGLQYTDVKGGLSWLKLDKKVKTQPVKKEEPLQFK